MAALFEMAVAAMIAAVMLLTIVLTSVNTNEASLHQTTRVDLQSKMLTVSKILESDFDRIGYKAPHPAIVTADSNSFTYATDYDNSNSVQQVHYYLGTTTDAIVALTANPRDHILYRDISGKPLWYANLGITRVNFSYKDSLGNATATPSAVKSISVKISMESMDPIDSVYVTEFWQKTFFPKNL